MKEVIMLDGKSLTIGDVYNISFNEYKVQVSEPSKERVKRSRNVVDEFLRRAYRYQSKLPRIYGLNTGVGAQSSKSLSARAFIKFGIDYLVRHDVCFGKPFDYEITRGIMACNINRFLQGHSSVSLEYIEQMKELLNKTSKELYPSIPQEGSIGSSGDLPQLARLFLTSMGYTKFIQKGEEIPAKKALGILDMEFYKPEPGEPLSATNGPVVINALGALSVKKSIDCIKLNEIALSLTGEAIGMHTDPFDSGIHEKLDEQSLYSENILRLVDESKLTNTQRDTQDAYYFRTSPQAAAKTIKNIKDSVQWVEKYINSPLDNPLIFPDRIDDLDNCRNEEFKEAFVFCGAFQGQPVGQMADELSIGISKLTSAAKEGISVLNNPCLNNNSPAFITNMSAGTGWMVMEYANAAAYVENLRCSTPSTAVNVPVSNGKENVNSFGTIAVRYLWENIRRWRRSISNELGAACDAIDINNNKDNLGRGTQVAYNTIRRVAPYLPDADDLLEEVGSITEYVDIIEDSLGSVIENVEAEVGVLF